MFNKIFFYTNYLMKYNKNKFNKLNIIIMM